VECLYCCCLQLKSDAKESFEKLDCSPVVKNVRNICSPSVNYYWASIGRQETCLSHVDLGTTDSFVRNIES